MPAHLDKHHRVPAEMMSHAVRLYCRLCFSYRDVEELLFAHGITVTYDAVRRWCRKYGPPDANQFRHRWPRAGNMWPMDEMCLSIRGQRHDLWRAVDQDGHGLDILRQRRRKKKAAKKLFRDTAV